MRNIISISISLAYVSISAFILIIANGCFTQEKFTPPEGMQGERWEFLDVFCISKSDNGIYLVFPKGGLIEYSVDDKGNMAILKQYTGFGLNQGTLEKRPTIKDDVIYATGPGSTVRAYDIKGEKELYRFIAVSDWILDISDSYILILESNIVDGDYKVYLYPKANPEGDGLIVLDTANWTAFGAVEDQGVVCLALTDFSTPEYNPEMQLDEQLRNLNKPPAEKIVITNLATNQEKDVSAISHHWWSVAGDGYYVIFDLENIVIFDSSGQLIQEINIAGDQGRFSGGSRPAKHDTSNVVFTTWLNPFMAKENYLWHLKRVGEKWEVKTYTTKEMLEHIIFLNNLYIGVYRSGICVYKVSGGDLKLIHKYKFQLAKDSALVDLKKVK